MNQQQIFRNRHGIVDGCVASQELVIIDPSGKVRPLDRKILAKTGLDKSFRLSKKHCFLRLQEHLMTDNLIDEGAQGIIADSLLGAVKKGYKITITDDNGKDQPHALALALTADGRIHEDEIGIAPASGTRLNFHRTQDPIDGCELAQTIGGVMARLQTTESDAEFKTLNAQLYKAFQADRDSGLIDQNVRFFQYKLQFADLTTDTFNEDGLRWKKGDHKLDAVAWAFAHLRASDLPENEQHYFWVELSWMVNGEKKETSQNMALPIKYDKQVDLVAGVEQCLTDEGWDISGLTINVAVDDYTYSLPSSASVLAQIENLRPGTCKALLADKAGNRCR